MSDDEKGTELEWSLFPAAAWATVAQGLVMDRNISEIGCIALSCLEKSSTWPSPARVLPKPVGRVSMLA